MHMYACEVFTKLLYIWKLTDEITLYTIRPYVKILSFYMYKRKSAIANNTLSKFCLLKSKLTNMYFYFLFGNINYE